MKDHPGIKGNVGRMNQIKGEFWAALVISAAPFVATPWVNLLIFLNSGSPSRAIGIFFLTSLVFVVSGIILLFFAFYFLNGNPDATEKGKRIGAGILAGMSLGFIAGFASCFTLVNG
jgi:hypothetical protein